MRKLVSYLLLAGFVLPTLVACNKPEDTGPIPPASAKRMTLEEAEKGRPKARGQSEK